MGQKRNSAERIARETVVAVTGGRYTNLAGMTVPLRHLVKAARDGTVSYPPDAMVAPPAMSRVETRTTVVNDTTLVAARQLAAEGFRVVALNFASARHPGGGFLGGARAQEESLCRSSALYACINGNPMYAHHAPMPGGFYTNYAIYSPDVPVFRTDDGDWLDEPYVCSFITSPAVNVGALRGGESEATIRDEMRERIDKVLAIAAAHGHRAIVLGAWGCGVFRNNPEMIAELFASALRRRYANVFERVVFAVLDSTGDGKTIGPFAERFGGVT